MKRYLARFFIVLTLVITMIVSFLVGLILFYDVAYIIASMACIALFLELRLWLDDWYIEEMSKILYNEENDQNNKS